MPDTPEQLTTTATEADQQHEQNLVDFFREAAPYIHMHRGKTFVIALSGEVLLHPAIGELLSDVAILSTLGARIILVHGARPQIDAQLNSRNRSTPFHNGLRITDSDALEDSKAAIGAARLEIENHLNRALNRPPIVNNSLGVISGNFITAKPLGVIDGIDHMHTGKVRKVNHKLLESLISQDNIILLSPLGYSPTGQIYNVLFEEVASATASKLNADKLIFVHDNDDLPLLPKQLNMKQLNTLKTTYEDRIFQEISHALQAGVERAHVVDMDIRGGLLLELYTRDGIGSMFSSGLYDEPRDAVIDDVGGILDLIRPLEAVGTLKKRSREQLELEIGNFSVIERDGKIIGCAALYEIPESDMAELACLAIHDDYRSGKRGIELVNKINEMAMDRGVKRLMVLTTQSTDWFSERGFELSSIEALPEQRKALYNFQRNSKILIKKIESRHKSGQ